MTAIITQDDLNEIYSALGFPVITSAEFDFAYLTTYVVPRVLRKFFTFYPLKHDTNQPISTVFEIPYPDASQLYSPNYTVTRMYRHFFNYKQDDYGNFSPFLLQAMVMDRRPFGQAFSLNQLGDVINRISTAEAVIDWSKALRVEDYPDQRKVKGSVNMSGDLSIQWAVMSSNFSDIPFNFRDDAIKLAKAYLLLDSSRLRTQAIIQSKVSINVEMMAEEGKKWEAEVIAKWEGRAQAVVIKS